jgi:hypothetical protein
MRYAPRAENSLRLGWKPAGGWRPRLGWTGYNKEENCSIFFIETYDQNGFYHSLVFLHKD